MRNVHILKRCLFSRPCPTHFTFSHPSYKRGPRRGTLPGVPPGISGIEPLLVPFCIL